MNARAVDSRTVQRVVPQRSLEYNTGAFTIAHRALLNPNNFTIPDKENKKGTTMSLTRK